MYSYLFLELIPINPNSKSKCSLYLGAKFLATIADPISLALYTDSL